MPPTAKTTREEEIGSNQESANKWYHEIRNCFKRRKYRRSDKEKRIEVQSKERIVVCLEKKLLHGNASERLYKDGTEL